MKRILVIDDNNDLLETFRILLEMKGFEVFTLERGEDTFDTIRFFCPNIILLDIFLAGMSGIDICKELKLSKETKHIPVVMISAHAKGETALQECAAEAFVAKPFDLPYLTGVIESLLIKAA